MHVHHDKSSKREFWICWVKVGQYEMDPTVVLPASTALSVQRSDAIHSLASIATSPTVSLSSLIKNPTQALLRYSLEFIPIVGPLAYAYLEGERTGITAHTRYFSLKRMSALQRGQWVLERRGAYAQFGFVAALLEGIPVVGTIAGFTNVVGAAVWAGELERRQELLRPKGRAKTVRRW